MSPNTQQRSNVETPRLEIYVLYRVPAGNSEYIMYEVPIS